MSLCASGSLIEWNAVSEATRAMDGLDTFV
jgi:hypothetical protein